MSAVDSSGGAATKAQQPSADPYVFAARTVRCRLPLAAALPSDCSALQTSLLRCRLRFLKAFFRYRVKLLGSRKPCTDRKLVYLVRCLQICCASVLFTCAWACADKGTASLARWGLASGTERPAAGSRGTCWLVACCRPRNRWLTLPPAHTRCLLPTRSARQANHRGWTDFFVDMFVSGARAVPLSRCAVAGVGRGSPVGAGCCLGAPCPPCLHSCNLNPAAAFGPTAAP